MRFRLFTLADVPVDMSLWYVFLAVILVRGNVVAGVLWLGAITISLLVHEFGHALVARRFRLAPRVLLHGFGGLCEHSEAESDRDDALVVAAGPAAGLLLGALVAGLHLGITPLLPAERWAMLLDMFLGYMVWINIGWSLVNLLPVWPLDGGQLFRLGLSQFLAPLQVERITHVTAIALLLVLGPLLATQLGGPLFLWFLVALGVWMNVRALRGEIRSGAFRPKSREAGRLLKSAKESYASEDWREAARLGHLIRQEKNIPRGVLQETWAILGPATARLGHLEEARSYLSRAKDTRDVLEAKVEVFYGLGMDKELREVLESSGFQRLVPEERRLEILSVVDDKENASST